jgi:hypothetical protein
MFFFQWKKVRNNTTLKSGFKTRYRDVLKGYGLVAAFKLVVSFF